LPLAAEERLLMKQEGIVNHRLDALRGQVCAQSLAVFALDDEEMINVRSRLRRIG
jgi:hypothetical protein